MDAADGFHQQSTDVNRLDLVTLHLLHVMRHCVRDDHLHVTMSMLSHFTHVNKQHLKGGCQRGKVKHQRVLLLTLLASALLPINFVLIPDVFVLFCFPFESFKR